MSEQLVVAAWNCWLQLVNARKRQALVFRKAASRLLQAQLSSAWQKWAAIVQDAVVRHNILARVVQRLSHMSLAVAMGHWAYIVAEIQIQRAHESQLLNTVLRRMGNRCLWSTFTVWVGAVNAHKDSISEQQRVEQNGKRALMRLRQSWLGAAFSRWVEMTVTQRRHRQILGSVLTRLSHARLTSAFDGWRYELANASRRARLMAQFVARMRHAVLWSVVRAWQHRLKQTRLQHASAVRVLSHLRHRSLSSPFKQWAFTIRKQRAINATRRKVFAKILHLKLFAAWNAWCESIAVIARNRSIVSRTIGRLKHKVQARSFAEWCGRVKDEAYYRSLMTKIVSRLSNQQMYRAFAAWTRLSRLRKLTRKVASRLQNRALHLRFWQWERHAHASRQLWLSAAIPEIAQQRIGELEDTVIKARDDAEAARNAMMAEGPLTLLAQLEAELAAARSETAQLRAIVAANRENAQLEVESGFKRGEQQAKRQILMNERQRRERHAAQLQAAEEAARKAQLAEDDIKRRHRAEADFYRRSREELERQYAEKQSLVEERFEQVMLSYCAHRNHRSERSRREIMRQTLIAWQTMCAGFLPVPEGVPPTPTKRHEEARATSRASPRHPTAVGTLASPPSLLKGGKLKKLSKGEWKSRWVELLTISSEASEEELSTAWIIYRKNEQSSRDLGRLDLSGCTMASTTTIVEGTTRQTFTLVNSVDSERFTFAAETEEDMTAWTAMLLPVLPESGK